MTARGSGTGKLKTSLERIPKDQVTKPATTAPAKTGLEVSRDHGWQRNAEAEPTTMVRVIDHDADGRTLFSGSEAQFKRLKQALDRKED